MLNITVVEQIRSRTATTAPERLTESVSVADSVGLAIPSLGRVEADQSAVMTSVSTLSVTDSGRVSRST